MKPPLSNSADLKTDDTHLKKDRIRILIVDDHKALRDGLKGLLQLEPGFKVIGEAENGKQAVEQSKTLSPDVIIMDINLGDTDGITVTRKIISKQPHTKVIGLSMHDDQSIVDAMFQAGAVAYLSKGSPSQEIINAIKDSS